MRFRKNAVPVPVTRDLLQEKQTEVARLARQASEAVDIVTRTMNELEGINQQIDNDLAEIDTYSKELAATRAAMSQQRKNNTAMPYLFEDMTVGSFFSGIGAFEKALSTFDITDVSDKVNYSDKNDELKQLGYINDYNGDANRVYDGETIARALKAEAGGGGAKTGWYALRSPEVDHGESQN